MLDWAGEKIDFKSSGVNFHGFGFQPSYGKPYKPDELAPRDILFACGGSMLIDRKIFLEIGGFDPEYFAFFEDVDLGWRLWLLGYRVTLTPTAITYHRHHGTAGSMSAHRTYVLYERNALYTIYKNYEESHVHKILSAALFCSAVALSASSKPAASPSLTSTSTTPTPTTTRTSSIHRNAVAALLAANEFSDNLEQVARKARMDPIPPQAQPTTSYSPCSASRAASTGLTTKLTPPTPPPTTPFFNDFGIGDLWSDLPKEVLLISPDVLPVGDIPATRLRHPRLGSRQRPGSTGSQCPLYHARPRNQRTRGQRSAGICRWRLVARQPPVHCRPSGS